MYCTVCHACNATQCSAAWCVWVLWVVSTTVRTAASILQLTAPCSPQRPLLCGNRVRRQSLSPFQPKPHTAAAAGSIQPAEQGASTATTARCADGSRCSDRASGHSTAVVARVSCLDACMACGLHLHAALLTGLWCHRCSIWYIYASGRTRVNFLLVWCAPSCLLIVGWCACYADCACMTAHCSNTRQAGALAHLLSSFYYVFAPP